MGLKIGIVAGEESGDILGHDLIIALKKRYPDATFEGIGGKRMIAQGFKSLYPLDRLSVMGFIEPLKRLPEILRIRKGLKHHFLNQKTDLFIGIDAPDFNLSLEQVLKSKGIKTVHYVSPTVWAWRSKRIKTIKKSIDLMLTIFPFEKRIFEENGIPVCFVGHSLADSIPMHSDKNKARLELNLPLEGKIVALLPGSRAQELKYLAKDFIQTAKWMLQRNPDIRFISACPNELREQQLRAYLQELGGLDINIFQGQATTIMAASDAILLASGTASLQAMLVKRPTVIAYKMSPLVFAIAKRIVKIPYIGLPNLLANKSVMPEFIQAEVIPEKMGQQLLAFLDSPTDNEKQNAFYEKMHLELKKNAGETAATAIGQLIKGQ